MREMESIPFVDYLDLFKNRGKAQSKLIEVEAIKLMPKVEARTVKEFNVLIHLLFKVQFNSALVQSIGLELLGKMRRMGHFPDAITYTTLINLLRKDPDPSKAWKVFRSMREQNVNPTEVTYGVMTHICALKRKTNDAEELIELMQVDGVTPNVVIMSNLTETFLSAGKVKRAWEIMGYMSRRHRVYPNQVTLGYLMKSCVRCDSEWDAWIEQHRKKGRKATPQASEAESEEEKTDQDQKRDSASRTNQVPVPERINRIRVLLRYMEDKYYISPSLENFNSVIAWCTKDSRNHIELAWKLKELMKEYQLRPNSVTYTPLLNGYVKLLKLRQANGGIAQEQENAEDGFQRVLQDIQNEGIPPDTTTMAMILDAYNACGDYQQCLETYSQMRTDYPQFTLHTYAMLLQVCEKQRNAEVAFDLWEDKLKDKMRVPWNVACSLMRATLAYGDTDRALKVARELERLFEAQFIYHQLLKICDERAEISKAKRVWSVVQDKGIALCASAYKLLSVMGIIPPSSASAALHANNTP